MQYILKLRSLRFQEIIYLKFSETNKRYLYKFHDITFINPQDLKSRRQIINKTGIFSITEGKYAAIVKVTDIDYIIRTDKHHHYYLHVDTLSEEDFKKIENFVEGNFFNYIPEKYITDLRSFRYVTYAFPVEIIPIRKIDINKPIDEIIDLIVDLEEDLDDNQF